MAAGRRASAGEEDERNGKEEREQQVELQVGGHGWFDLEPLGLREFGNFACEILRWSVARDTMGTMRHMTGSSHGGTFARREWLLASTFAKRLALV
jgi:hypothetical protein